MKISIVMTTYNGEKYIVPQLESLLAQTIVVDEVIISDDCSNDKTVEVIKEFIRSHDLKNWNIIENKNNIGWRENFINPIKSALGDIIFFSDQDDIWKNDKIEIMSKKMRLNKNINVLVSNFTPFYEANSRKIKNRITKNLNADGSVEQIKFSEHFMYCDRPGCVMAMRKDFFEGIFHYWFNDCAHDAFIWRYSILCDGLYLLNNSTIYYRRHNNNATGFEKRNKEYYVNTIIYYCKVIKDLKAFIETSNVNNKCEKARILDKALKWAELREQLLSQNKLINLFNLLPYYRYYASYKSYFRDILCIIR